MARHKYLANFRLGHAEGKCRRSDDTPRFGGTATAEVRPQYADLQLSPGEAGQDRRRRLLAYSRYEETPPNHVIEWSADGTDYLGLGVCGEPDFARSWPVLRALLENADKPLTRKAIGRAWPETSPLPAQKTLWKWLDQAAHDRQALKDGLGKR